MSDAAANVAVFVGASLPRRRPRLPNSSSLNVPLELAAESRPVEVPAATVAAAFSHLLSVEAVLEGMPREEAFDASAAFFYIRVLPGLMLGRRRRGDFTEFSSAQVHPAGWPPQETETVLEWRAGARWTGACLAVSAEQHRDVLHSGGGRPPLVRLPAGEAARLAWLEEAVRRFGTGAGPFPVCARGAHDQHLGRPRRRREPADGAWLVGEVRGALEAAWTALSPLRVPVDPDHFRALPALRPRLPRG